MKRAIFTFILAAGLTVSAASAQSSATPAIVPSGHGGMMQGGMMQSDMAQESEAMQAHHQKMEEMRALMERAHAATNPAERQRLMAEHH